MGSAVEWLDAHGPWPRAEHPAAVVDAERERLERYRRELAALGGS